MFTLHSSPVQSHSVRSAFVLCLIQAIKGKSLTRPGYGRCKNLLHLPTQDI